MSTTSMLTGNSLTVKNWSKARYDWMQMSQGSAFGHLFTRGSIYIPPEMSGRNASSVKGDQITFSYIGKSTGDLYGEGDTVEGNEEALDLQSQSSKWSVTRKAFKNPNDEDTIEAQRTYIEFEQSSRKAIMNRYIEVLDTGFFYHLAGASPTSITLDGVTTSGTTALTRLLGHNLPAAPSTNRIIRAGGVANDQSLTSSNKMTLSLVDYMLEKAGNSTQSISYLDGNTYDLYVSHEQLVDLQHDTTSPVQWYTNELAALQAGNADNKIQNRFMNGMACAGKYRNVFIYAHPRVAYGVNSSTSAIITNVRRAVLVGRDALVWLSPFGGRPSDKDIPLRYKTEDSDYGYYRGVEGRIIYGIDKNSPSNKEDVGVIVCSTYAATHA